MKTEIIDNTKYQYPFEITPDALTINFAVFQSGINGSRQQYLALFKPGDENGDVIFDWEAKNWNHVCIAKGSYAYKGDNPRGQEWESDMTTMANDPDKKEIAELESKIKERVIKCLKGGLPQSEASEEGTYLTYVPWLAENTDVDRTKDDVTSEKTSTPPPVPLQALYPQGQPTVTIGAGY